MGSYNDWTNRKTWLVNLHYGDTLTALTQDADRAQAQPTYTGALSNAMRQAVQDDLAQYNNPDDTPIDLFDLRFPTSALNQVDWTQLAIAYLIDCI